MNRNQEAVMQQLMELVGSWGVEPTRTESDSMSFVRAVLGGMGEEKDGSLLLELGFLPTAEADYPEDFSLFQIYATLATDLSEAAQPEILRQLNLINMETVLGNYGIYQDGGQLYFRHVGIVRGAEPKQMMETIQPAINWCVTTLDEDFDRLLSLCNK